MEKTPMPGLDEFLAQAQHGIITDAERLDASGRKVEPWTNVQRVAMMVAARSLNTAYNLVADALNEDVPAEAAVTMLMPALLGYCTALDAILHMGDGVANAASTFLTMEA